MRVTVFIFLVTSLGLAQESELYLRSVSIGNGIGSASNYTYIGKFSANADIAMEYKSNIFSFYLNVGSSISTVGYDIKEHHGLYLTYGRELDLAKWFKLEAHAGFGYANYIGILRENTQVHRTNRVPAVPLNVKILFYPYRSFGLGLNPTVNFSSFTTVYSANLLFQWRFR